MNPSRIFITRPVMTCLVMITFLFFGIVSYFKLPVSDLPSVEYPTISVSTGYPGGNPVIMANNITAPLERQFATIDGVKTMTSSSYNGYSQIALQFDLKKSIVIAAQDVQQAINAAMAYLPANLPQNPQYQKVNPAASPILYFAVTGSDMSLGDLYNYANNVIGEQINMLSGVSQVSTIGSPFAVRVRVNPQKIAAKGISFDEVASAISNQNVFQSTGTLYGNNIEYNLDVDGQLDDAKYYREMAIKAEDGSIVRISDVGTAINGLNNDKFSLDFFTKEVKEPCLIISVQKQPDSNTVIVAGQVKERIKNLSSQVPSQIKIIPMFDKSVFIDESVNDVETTLLIAIGLVAAVIFIYLGRIRNMLIPVIALPIAVIGTFAVLYVLGYSIDILSLLALTLSIGFLVDDAVVVLENIHRHVEMKKTPFQAAIDASKEIGFTILSMTLSLLAVFIPLLFMGGVIGRLFHEFAITIFSAVLLSGIISLTLTPMLSAKFTPPFSEEKNKTKLEHFSEKINQSMINVYSKGLEWAVKHRLIILSFGLFCIVAAGYLFMILPKDFLPPSDLGFIQGFTQASDPTSPYKMMDYQNIANDKIRAYPYAYQTCAVGGYPQGNQGLFFIRLTDKKRPKMLKIIETLDKELNEIPGIQAFLKPLPLISLDVGTGQAMGNYQYTLKSLTTTDLFPAATALLHKMQQMKGFTQVTYDLHNDLPQVNIRIKRDRASMLGVTAHDIENAVGLAFAGADLSEINTPINTFYAILEVLPKFYRSPEDLRQIYVVSSGTGSLVPLNQIAEISESTGPVSINHTDGLPSVTFTFNIVDLPLSIALQNLEKVARDTLPPNVKASLQGTADVFKSSFASLISLFFVTIFVIYIILGILYENTLHPITVMSTLPPAIMGGLLTLLLTGSTVSLYSFVGLILLLGIVLKNGIIMVDFANVSIAEGMSIHDAIVHACKVRFRPIIMTTFAAMMGAVPIAIGLGGADAEGRRPLGYVIIGGLILSQIITLFVTPVVFIYIEKLREWVLAKRQKPA